MKIGKISRTGRRSLAAISISSTASVSRSGGLIAANSLLELQREKENADRDRQPAFPVDGTHFGGRPIARFSMMDGSRAITWSGCGA
jgi:hypothetical protein